MKFRLALISLVLFFICTDTLAANGYTIDVTIKDKNLFSTNLLLCYYYGSSKNIQIADTAKIDNFGKAKFKNTQKIIGGIYLLYTFDTKKSIEFLLNDGDKFQLEISFEKYPFDSKAVNSNENIRFIDYQKVVRWYSTSAQKKSTSGKDSLFTYRRKYVSQYPTDFLSKVFNLLIVPEVNSTPKNHQDSVSNYENYKNHFWDYADLKDDRIVYTPLFEDKVKTYISLIDPSNFNNDIDRLLSNADSSNFCFAYLITKIIRETEISSYLYLGYYEKYVYIIDKYITNNTNQYITTDLKEKLLDKSTKLKKMETSAYITNVICTKSEVETARNAQSKGITIEQQIEENKRLAELKKSIERGSFTGEHYYDYENYKYIGHFLNGKPDGNGKWEKVDGSWYSGQFKNGVENGIGTLRQTDGFRYTGNFTDGVPNGKMKVEKWTLMGLAKNAWTAEYKMGQLISSEQTEDGMDKLFSSKGSSSSSSSSPSNTNSSNQDYKETKNSIQNVTFEIDRKNACQDAIESYEIRVYEDGKRLEKITVAKRKDNQWLDYCPGSILGGSYLTNGGSLINALKYYYTKILKKTAISFDLKE